LSYLFISLELYAYTHTNTHTHTHTHTHEWNCWVIWSLCVCTFEKLPACSPKWPYHFTFSLPAHEDSILSYLCQHLWLCVFFDYSGCEIVSHRGFAFSANDVLIGHLFMPVVHLWRIVYSNYLPILKLDYRLLNCKSFLYYPAYKFLSGVWFFYIFFSTLKGCLYTFICLFIYFGGTGVWTQGFIFAKQKFTKQHSMAWATLLVHFDLVILPLFFLSLSGGSTDI
jgi:hypothetical protein